VALLQRVPPQATSAAQQIDRVISTSLRWLQVGPRLSLREMNE
jgi:hypothetical protein